MVKEASVQYYEGTCTVFTLPQYYLCSDIEKYDVYISIQYTPGAITGNYPGHDAVNNSSPTWPSTIKVPQGSSITGEISVVYRLNESNIDRYPSMSPTGDILLLYFTDVNNVECKVDVSEVRWVPGRTEGDICYEGNYESFKFTLTPTAENWSVRIGLGN